MASDPRSWIYSFLDHVPGIIAKPARWIADRIFGIFDDAVAFARYIGDAFRVLRDRIASHIASLISFGIETINTLRWILTVEIPRRVKAGLDSAINWARTEIAKAKNVLTSTINTLRTWAQKAIGVVDKFVHDVLKWASDQVAKIRDYLNKTVGVWYDRLTDPRKFAAWVAGAIAGALLSYVFGQRDRIASWFLRTSPAFTVWLARALEDVLRRLL